MNWPQAFVAELSRKDRRVLSVMIEVNRSAFFWDSEIKGFGLRVTARGAKSFVLDYRVGARQRRITLGNYPDWTVQAARVAAKALKRDVDLGQDPMGERHALREAPTMQDLWERYQSEKLPTKAPRTQIDERSMWQNIILPRLAKHRVTDGRAEEPQHALPRIVVLHIPHSCVDMKSSIKRWFCSEEEAAAAGWRKAKR